MLGADLLYQGFELMLVGMGTVFVFLTTLVAATNAMSWLVLRSAPPVPAAAEAEEAEEVAAITAAVAEFRRRR